MIDVPNWLLKLGVALVLVLGLFILVPMALQTGSVLTLLPALFFGLSLVVIVVKTIAQPLSRFVNATFKRVPPDFIAVIIGNDGRYRIVRKGPFIVWPRQTVFYVRASSSWVPFEFRDVQDNTNTLIAVRGTMNARVQQDDASVIKAVVHNLNSWPNMAHASSTLLESGVRHIIRTRTTSEILQNYRDLAKEAKRIVDAEFNEVGLELELVHIESLALGA